MLCSGHAISIMDNIIDLLSLFVYIISYLSCGWVCYASVLNNIPSLFVWDPAMILRLGCRADIPHDWPDNTQCTWLVKPPFEINETSWQITIKTKIQLLSVYEQFITATDTFWVYLCYSQDATHVLSYLLQTFLLTLLASHWLVCPAPIVMLTVILLHY